jgi:hypothetical protein
MRLTSSSAALGLPEGSIRAIIALVLILVFVVMSIFLFNAVFLADGVGPAARNNAATQVLAVLGTLVTAVAAFYFGTSAVTTGSVAATAAIGAAQAQGPAAITKGSRLDTDEYALAGLVNPRGRQTSYYFEYGRESSYGKTTAVQSAGSGNDEQMFEEKVPRGDVVHLRIVAFNDAGKSQGDDAQVDKIFNEDGTDPGAGEPPMVDPQPTPAPTVGNEDATRAGEPAAKVEGNAEEIPPQGENESQTDEADR